MTHDEAQDVFTNEDSWSHGIAPLEDEHFGLTASRLWDALSDEERDDFAAEFAAYYSK